MKQNISFNEEDLKQIKDHMKDQGLGKEYRGEITNQSTIDESIRISNLVLKHLCPLDLLNLGITKQ